MKVEFRKSNTIMIMPDTWAEYYALKQWQEKGGAIGYTEPETPEVDSDA